MVYGVRTTSGLNSCQYIDINIDMNDRGPYRIPSESALLAFEAAARHGNFSQAANELRTSQPAVSRHIAGLERELAARLFERSHTGVTLTEAGRHFRDAVVAGLGAIHAGVTTAAYVPNGQQVVIACAHDASHLVVFPRYDALCDMLGKDTRVRLLTYQRSVENMPVSPVADVVLAWNGASDVAAEDMAPVFTEQLQLVCSPHYAAAHADTLCKPIADWDGLTFLDLNMPNLGWAAWLDWFEMAGHPASTPRFAGFDNYIQVLEAAAAGLGIALGWRNYIEPYVASGAIEMLAEGFVEFDNRFVAALTEKGRSNPDARKCLAFFERWESHAPG